MAVAPGRGRGDDENSASEQGLLSADQAPDLFGAEEVRAMRMLLRARMETEHGNRAIQSGAMEKTLASVLDELKPEAAYFVAEEGRRCALIFFDMQEASELPRICEPFFMEYDAEVSVQPAMTIEDIRAGFAEWAGRR